MGLFGFTSGADVALFVTSLFSGISMLVGVTAVNSAPAFMLDYYKYLQDNPDATATYATFWAKVLTFYSIVTLVTQTIAEPLNLTQFMCRFSLMFRLQASSLLMIIELLIILIMPHTRTPEVAAMVGIIIAAFIGGVGRAFYENTGYALFGPCPSKHMSGILIGAAMCGVLLSIIQIALLGSMPNSYHNLLIESILYFAIALAIFVVNSVLLVLLLCNPYAKRYIAEFRSRRSVWANMYRRVTRQPRHMHDDGGVRQASDDASTSGVTTTTAAAMVMLSEEQRAMSEPVAGAGDKDGVVLPQQSSSSSSQQQQQHVCGTALIGNDREHEPKYIGNDDDNDVVDEVDYAPTTSELLQTARLGTVMRKTYPMMLSCYGVFFVTYIMFPGVLIAVDPDNDWFTTTLMAVYNLCDFAGRVLSMWKRTWPSRRVVMVGAAVRVVFVPLMVLCAVHKIPTHAAAYVFTAILAVTNGFFGTLTMVFTTETDELVTDGERALAGQASGVCLLAGCAIGSLLQLAVVLPL